MHIAIATSTDTIDKILQISHINPLFPNLHHLIVVLEICDFSKNRIIISLADAQGFVIFLVHLLLFIFNNQQTSI